MMTFNANNNVNFLGLTGRASRLFLAMLSTWQVCVPVVLTMASSSLLITAEAAEAREAMAVTIVQAFGWDTSEVKYKMLIQLKNGDQYYVWYSDLIGAKVGSVINLTYDGSGSSMSFYKLTNFGNGKESSIYKVSKAN